jgi:hypothetical protein
MRRQKGKSLLRLFLPSMIHAKNINPEELMVTDCISAFA